MSTPAEQAAPRELPSLSARQEFASELAFAMDKAGKLGLYGTMQALHEVVRVVGWEIAETVEKAKAGAELVKE